MCIFTARLSALKKDKIIAENKKKANKKSNEKKLQDAFKKILGNYS